MTSLKICRKLDIRFSCLVQIEALKWAQTDPVHKKWIFQVDYTYVLKQDKVNPYKYKNEPSQIAKPRKCKKKKKNLFAIPFFYKRPNYNFVTLVYILHNQNKWKAELIKIKKKIKSFPNPKSTKIDLTLAKYKTTPTNPRRCRPIKNEFWVKNYIDLVPLKVRMKPMNKFASNWMSKNKIERPTPKKDKVSK